MKININFPDNTRLSFTERGLFMSVSLNVKQEVARFLPKDSVHKTLKRTVYFVKSKDPVQNNVFKIDQEYLKLLNKCMLDVRNAKKAALELEIKQLKEVEVQLTLF